MSGCEQEKREQETCTRTEAARYPTFGDLIGIGKETFAQLGGGEAFIMGERAAFYGDERDDEYGGAL